MTVILIIFCLQIESSYAQKIEVPAEECGDTVQWVISAESVWRIRTFAMDYDVHPHTIGRADKTDAELRELALANTRKHYGDVLGTMYVFSSETGIDGLRDAMIAYGVTPRLNTGSGGLVFWAPDEHNYKTRTNPG